VTIEQGLIAKYLEPESKGATDSYAAQKERERTEEELLDMRNRTVFGFLTMNIAFVITLLVLQSYTEDVFGVAWLPEHCIRNTNSSSNDISSGSKIEPVGLAFLFLFGTILLIQALGMIAHRLGTFLHVIAITTINFRLRCRANKSSEENYPANEDMDDDSDGDEVRLGSRSVAARRRNVLSIIPRLRQLNQVLNGESRHTNYDSVNPNVEGAAHTRIVVGSGRELSFFNEAFTDSDEPVPKSERSVHF